MSKFDDADFAGWVTKNDIRCADGVTIRHGAFAKNDGTKVPMVWQHNYNSPSNVLGTMLLQARPEGTYGYGFFNGTEAAKDAKESVKHGDVTAMSIGAREIQKQGQNVVHGNIYEVSLVLAGANPGAKIEYSLEHSAYGDGEEEAVIEVPVMLHDATTEEGETKEAMADTKETKKPEGTDTKESKSERTVGDVLATFNEEQQEALELIVAQALASADESDDADDEDVSENGEGAADQNEVKQSAIEEGESTLKHNIFADNAEGTAQTTAGGELFHSAVTGADLSQQDLNKVIAHAYRSGSRSLNESLIEAGFGAQMNEDGVGLTHGIDLKHGLTNLDVLFPSTTLTKGIQTWNPQGKNVSKILSKFAAAPTGRIKNLFTNISEDEARARGYIKGTEKMESIEQFYFRETTPQTVMRKVKFNRDDIIDIQENGIDVTAWALQVQRAKLEEEVVRAAFFGDGRPATVLSGGDTVPNPAKIKEDHIRPIVKDHDLFTMKLTTENWVTFRDDLAFKMAAYEGSGTPDLYMHSIDIAKLRTAKDSNGRYIFGGYVNGNMPTLSDVAGSIGVNEVIEYRETPLGTAVVVNLNDYVFGASKGGQIVNFDFFDIDFNQYKYLIETRLSGALLSPKTAIAITVTSPGSKNLDDFKFDSKGLKDTPNWLLDSATGDIVPATGVTLNKPTLTKAAKEKETLIATVKPDNATNKTVKWVSADEAIATVSDKGEVTAVATGKTKILAIVDGNIATSTITVTG